MCPLIYIEVFGNQSQVRKHNIIYLKMTCLCQIYFIQMHWIQSLKDPNLRRQGTSCVWWINDDPTQKMREKAFYMGLEGT